ncbi:Metallo-dependent phosphatase-like protein [Mortierella sp. GBAus27b]|nr:Metallo-dependent phosphatase-like protein [Mortierella sp. GBAus27b]
MDSEAYRAHIDLVNKAFRDVEDILDDPDIDSCQMCQKGMVVAKNLSISAPNMVPGFLRILCLKYSYKRRDACAGLAERMGPQLAAFFSEMNLNGSDGYYTCAYNFPGSCPVPVHQPKPIEFPKPKPANAQQPAPSGETIQVLHFSDWHLDPHYKAGTEADCSHNICCRDFGRWNDPGPIKKPASKWGDGQCDTPIELGLSALQAIQKFVPKASFGIFTGDIVSHDAWLITEKYVAEEETRSYDLFKQYLQELKLYVAMGNHDSYPSDQAPGRMRPNSYITHKWLYEHVAGIWEKNNWITSIEADYARSHNAMYMTRPMPGLKLITINTDMYYVRNFYTMLDTDQDDPNGLFHDLILELQDSEDRNERGKFGLWIMGHMAPVTKSLPRSSSMFQRVVARYSPHVIAGIFSGHFHQDKFVVMHDPDAEEENEESAVNVVYQGPSVTPLDRSNPAIRWYDVDAKTFSVLNSHTVIADVIGQADYWEAHDMEPEWKLEYTARETYDDPAHPLAPGEPLSPGFWHRAVERMKGNRQLMEAYLKYESKSSLNAEPCLKGSVCEMESLCQMQASTVTQHQVCITQAEEALGKVTKKPNKKEPYGVTRAGKVIRIEDYDEQRGVNDGQEDVVKRSERIKTKGFQVSRRDDL